MVMKRLLIKSRAKEIRDRLRAQLKKEKKHQWYVLQRKKYANSADLRQQEKVEKEMNPELDIPSQSTTVVPFSSIFIGGVGIAAFVLLVGNRFVYRN